ncbi:hypothetical protein QE379_002263 [Sphingomonas sp. SORGH_AS 879]|nr:hypothetical protein [Sphingomonas sp. SORGH_AS_0879]
MKRRQDKRLMGASCPHFRPAHRSSLDRTPSRAESDLRSWGLTLRERLGFKRAAVAVARKLAVIMHSMLTTGEPFRSTAATI